MSEVNFVPMQVDYVAHLGSDVNVVNAARVSFAKEVQDFDVEKDTKLINYLAKHNQDGVAILAIQPSADGCLFGRLLQVQPVQCMKE